MINDNNTVCNINYKNMDFILCSYLCVSSLYLKEPCIDSQVKMGGGGQALIT